MPNFKVGDKFISTIEMRSDTWANGKILTVRSWEMIPFNDQISFKNEPFVILAVIGNPNWSSVDYLVYYLDKDITDLVSGNHVKKCIPIKIDTAKIWRETLNED